MEQAMSRRAFSRWAFMGTMGLAMETATAGGAPQPQPSDAGGASGSATRLAADEFPHQRDGVYLNHAASSPMPARTARALRAYADDRERLFHLYRTGTQDYALHVLQAKVARLLNSPPDRLALVPTTTDAMAGALNAIDWRPGDNVVVPANEFPGVLYPCLHLARRGVDVRQVPVDRHCDLDRVLGAIDRRTRAVAISHVHWQTGHRVDLTALGAACQAGGALSIVDAIQSVGGVPVDVTAAGIDVLAAGAYKWLMAIPGTAVVYASPRFLEQVVPDRAGHVNIDAAAAGTSRIAWVAGAARFHVGGPINAALIALEQSVDLLMGIGIAAIQTHVGTLLDRLIDGAGAAGLTVMSDVRPPHRSTFMNVSTGDATRDERLVKALVDAGIVVGFRGPGIRVAPHLHNSFDDVDRFLARARELRPA